MKLSIDVIHLDIHCNELEWLEWFWNGFGIRVAAQEIFYASRDLTEASRFQVNMLLEKTDQITNT